MEAERGRDNGGVVPASMSSSAELSVLCCTANIGNASFDSLVDWVPRHGVIPGTEGCYDLIVIGMQESTFGTTPEEKRILAEMKMIEDGQDNEGSGLILNEHQEFARYDVTPRSGSPSPSTAKHTEEKPPMSRSPHIMKRLIGKTSPKLMRKETTSRSRSRSPAGRSQSNIDDNGMLSPETKSRAEGSPGNGKSAVGAVLGVMTAPVVVAASAASTAAQHLVLNDTCSDYIRKVINDHLGLNYREVAKVRHGQMRLKIYANASVSVDEDSIRTDSVNTGLGSGRFRLRNKGGQVIRLDVLKSDGRKKTRTSISFVSSHLSAHEGDAHLERRNQSCREVLQTASVGKDSLDFASNVDYAFWMGDMNYRINLKRGEPGLGKSWDAERARASELVEQLTDSNENIQKKAFEILWQADELMADSIDTADPENDLVTLRGEVLYGWKTLKPRFKPTFKVLRELGMSYVSKRIPSWCDRVLWMSQPGFENRIRVIEYDMAPEFRTSDHKPVRCGFRIKTTQPPSLYEVNQAQEEVSPDTSIIIAFSKIKARNIACDDDNYKRDVPDPYFKFYLSSHGMLTKAKVAKQKHGKLQTKVTKFVKSAVAVVGNKSETTRTSYKHHDSNPNWRDDVYFSQVHLSPDASIEVYDECHIYVSCMDHGLKDYRLGSNSIPLREVYDHYLKGQPYRFNLELTNNGRRTGNVEGLIHFSHPKIKGDQSIHSLIFDAKERKAGRDSIPFKEYLDLQPKQVDKPVSRQQTNIFLKKEDEV